MNRRVRPTYTAPGLRQAQRAHRLPVYKSLSVLLMVEVFAGVGELCRAFARLGFQVLAWDLTMGPGYDLLVPENVRRLRRICGGAHFVHVGPPCGSFSIARRGSAPRSRQFPMGKPGLLENDRRRVEVGNKLMMVCVSLVRLCQERGVLWSWENPQSSRMWLCPAVRALFRRCKPTRVDLTFCAYGTAWRKATTFVFSRFLRVSHLAKKCVAKDVCFYSRNKHQILQGNTRSGATWTSVAQAYPRKLCDQIARVVQRFCVELLINRLDGRNTRVEVRPALPGRSRSRACASGGRRSCTAACPRENPVCSLCFRVWRTPLIVYLGSGPLFHKVRRSPSRCLRELEQAHACSENPPSPPCLQRRSAVSRSQKLWAWGWKDMVHQCLS